MVYRLKWIILQILYFQYFYDVTNTIQELKTVHNTADNYSLICPNISPEVVSPDGEGGLLVAARHSHVLGRGLPVVPALVVSLQLHLSLHLLHRVNPSIKLDKANYQRNRKTNTYTVFFSSWTMGLLWFSLGINFKDKTIKYWKSSVADPGCSYRIPDPNLFIPDPGSKRSWIPNPDPHRRT